MTSPDKSNPQPPQAIPIPLDEDQSYDAGSKWPRATQPGDLQAQALDTEFMLKSELACRLTLAQLALPRLQGPTSDVRLIDAQVLLNMRAQRPTGSAMRRMLTLQVAIDYEMPCGRCLQPMQQALQCEREFILVDDEGQAEALDQEIEDMDVISVRRFLKANKLVEDELLMSLPNALRHNHCVGIGATELQESVPERRNPFAALSDFKPKN